MSCGTAYDPLSVNNEKSSFFDIQKILLRGHYASIVKSLRVFTFYILDSFASADVISLDASCFLAPLESWITKSSNFFIRPNVEVVIDDSHSRDSGTPNFFYKFHGSEE